MPTYVHPVVVQENAFLAQACALFATAGTVRRQADATAGGENPMPGQAGIHRQLAERPADPAGGAAEAGQFGQLPVADHLPRRHLRQHQVQGLAARLGTAGSLPAQACSSVFPFLSAL